MMPSSRLLIVSNRLPVTAAATDGQVKLTRAGGGLSNGLRPFHEQTGGRWIGWPGDVARFTGSEQAELQKQLDARGIVPVELSPDQMDRFYHGFSNRVLWPLFHYLIDRVPVDVDAAGWETYRQVNEVFADVVVREYRRGDTIWVHDYQLMLLPALLRERLPNARVGFFLHIPFPSSEVFRILPWRHEILTGMLGADVIGFHTFAYMRHFLASLLHVAGVEAEVDRVRVDGREVKLGAFPMGIEATRFAELAQDPDVLIEVEEIRREAGGRKIVLGVDRLDYTKGIPRRLQAIERLLERDASLCDRFRYIQVAVPSRGEVDSYQRFKRQVEERVGRINGARGTLRSTPIHYVHRSVSARQLVALYMAADVMLVTPLRDGMNLVAKEFVASRTDEDGVLVLSEFAGAAAELQGAVIVNPYDVNAVAESLHNALSMPAGERRARMKALRRRVTEYNVHWWAEAFLDQLGAAHPDQPGPVASPKESSVVIALKEARQAARLRLLLDYDGTLVPITHAPELAAPDDELVALLGAVGRATDIQIDIVSGRPRQTLEAWLGHLPLALWAEHGFWCRSCADDPWRSAGCIVPNWMERIRPILEHFTASTPGSHLETKSACLAWHYRRAQREFGARQAHELRMLLGDALSNQPFEVIEGKKVIEVRLRGVSKAVVAHQVQAETAHDTIVVAIGDDRTDEDLFRALPASSLTISVGGRPSAARFRVKDHRDVRRLLRTLLDTTELIRMNAPAAFDGRA
jgi:trehalose 6-phosphate synthase/phosphatase